MTTHSTPPGPPAPGRLTDLDRGIIARTRKLLDAGCSIGRLREHTGETSETGSPYAAAFGEARYYLAALAAIAERLDAEQAGQ